MLDGGVLLGGRLVGVVDRNVVEHALEAARNGRNQGQRPSNGRQTARGPANSLEDELREDAGGDAERGREDDANLERSKSQTGQPRFEHSSTALVVPRHDSRCEGSSCSWSHFQR